MKALNIEQILTAGKLYAATAGSAIGAILTSLYGEGGDTAIKLFIMLIAMDWLSGIAASKKDGTYASSYGINGVYRTAVILMFPALGYYIDQILGTPNAVFYFILSGLAFHIFNSVAANIVRAGWSKWIPRKLIRFVQSEIEAKERRSEQKRK